MVTRAHIEGRLVRRTGWGHPTWHPSTVGSRVLVKNLSIRSIHTHDDCVRRVPLVRSPIERFRALSGITRQPTSSQNRSICSSSMR